MNIREIDIDQETQLEEFYQVGANVRSRNNDFELPWSENKDIEEFFAPNDVSCRLFIATANGKEGRIAAFQFSDSLDKGYLGWYECDPEDEISIQLLQTAEDYLKALRVKEILGPMNGSSWGSFRFNTISSKPLFATEPYQPLYYVTQWEKFGFDHEVLYETHKVPKDITRPMRLFQVKALALMVGVRFRKWPQNLIQEEDKLHDLHNFFDECFKENPLYRPISFEKYKQITIKLENILDFDHSYIFYDKKGKPASVLVSYKDIYHQMYLDGKLKDDAHKTYTLYMKTIATAKAFRGKHLSRVLVNFGVVEALRNGYQEVVFGTMMAENKSAQYSKSFFKAKALREYSFMKKVL